MAPSLVGRLKKEALIYLSLLIILSLAIHPERILIITSPMQLVHPFLWALLVYLLLWPFRLIGRSILKKFRQQS